MAVKGESPFDLMGASMTGETLVVLIVGDVASWTSDGRALPTSSEFVFAEVDEITPDFIEDLCPDIVLSSVFTPKFDALDLAEALCESGYVGRYRALAPRLPNPDVVRREVRAICQGIDFDVLMIDQAATLRPN